MCSRDRWENTRKLNPVRTKGPGLMFLELFLICFLGNSRVELNVEYRCRKRRVW